MAQTSPINLNDISGHLQGEIDGIDGADLADQLNDISGHFEQKYK